jgi:hypothetical protein
MSSGRRAAEATQTAPYLTHDMTHHGRHTPTPPDNSGHTRKPKSKKKREDRYEEEIQYNLSYNFRGANSRRQGQSTSTMRDDAGKIMYVPLLHTQSLTVFPCFLIIDYPPPPPTYETAVAVSTLVCEDFVHQGALPHPVPSSPRIPMPSLPIFPGRSHPGGSDRSDTSSINTASLSLLQPQSEEDRSSIELVDLDPSELWELDRQLRIPLDERVKRHRVRADTSTPSPIPHRTRLASQPTTRSPGSHARFLASQLSLRIPEDHDRYEDDRVHDNSDLSSPPTPKHRRMPSIPGSPSRFFHVRSHSPQPSSSVISLLRNPSPFFKSTTSLLNVSPSHHGTPHRTRTKLFHRKSKERASSEPLDDWEVLERTGSNQSYTDGSLPPPSPPVTPQNTALQQLPRSITPDVFVSESSRPAAGRVRKMSMMQIPQTVGAEIPRPASPPFVTRHVRRHTASSRGGQRDPSSAPVSPVSVSSASTFSSSTISLSQNTTATEDAPLTLQTLANWEYRSASPSPPCVLPGRGYESSIPSRTPRVSSPAPPTLPYEHDPELPILPDPGYGSLPARSATERIVRVPDARDNSHTIARGRSLSREMGMRSAPAYSSIFPSGPPMPLPNTSQTLPPRSSGHPSPRHHYPGRPLPATPPVSPSLIWILDKGATHVTPHPKAIVSAAPSTPPIPEGLLIDLDDDSLDTMPPGPPNHITPLCMDFLDDAKDEDDNGNDGDNSDNDNESDKGNESDNDNDNDDDNVSDSGTISPPGPLTPTTGFASASSISLSTSANRSVESFDTSMQTTPTSEAPDIDGLVSRLGDQGIADGSDYDVSPSIPGGAKSCNLNETSCPGASPHLRLHWSRQSPNTQC